MLTLSEAQSLLSDYVGANLTFASRLNLACERLIKGGNWSGTKVRVVFNAFPDAVGKAFITLPRALNTVLAIAPVPVDSESNSTKPLRIRNEWYQFYDSGAGYSDDQRTRWQRGLVTEPGRFTTFSDWTTPSRLRIKFEVAETASGLMVFRGFQNGVKIYSVIDGTWGEGCPLGLSASGATTTTYFDEAPYSVVKPVTNGRIFLYAVDASDNETLVAIYDPTETSIGWRRYKIPVRSDWSEQDPGQYITICKRAYVPVARDFDEVTPGNIGALRFALQALDKEDAEDFARARSLFAEAYFLLKNEVEDDTGPSAEGVVQVSDDFQISGISSGV